MMEHPNMNSGVEERELTVETLKSLLQEFESGGFTLDRFIDFMRSVHDQLEVDERSRPPGLKGG